jgi:hypothetical protein
MAKATGPDLEPQPPRSSRSPLSSIARSNRSPPPRSTHISRSTHLPRSPEVVKWLRPEAGFIKLNSDACLTLVDFWGIGVIARDDCGMVVDSGTWLCPGFECAAAAEAWGLYQAALHAVERGFQKVHFESDSERVNKLILKEEEEQRTYLGSIVRCIKSLVSMFSESKFTHVKRKGNSVAHCLAHLATTNPNRVWAGEVPDPAQSLYFHDLIS